ncbi:MAG: ankyrin repeat domain-containing protein [Culicoidibacterales bacterium]
MESIFTAILQQNLTAIQTYLESGQTLAIKNQNGQSPLQVAIMVGNTEIIQLLIEQKANFCAVDVSNSEGKTAK